MKRLSVSGFFICLGDEMMTGEEKVIDDFFGKKKKLKCATFLFSRILAGWW